jgi:cytoskeletal protein CcmA (bactofilin family)
MFDRRRPRQPRLQMTNLSSLIADGVEITGDLVFSGGLRIDGHVRGQLLGRPLDGTPPPLLVLSDRGRVDGSVRCVNAVINGTIEGDLEVEQFVELQAGARVTGTIRYRQMQMELGAVVQGRMLCHDDAGAAPAAPAVPVDAAADVALAAGAGKVVALPTEHPQQANAPRWASGDGR